MMRHLIPMAIMSMLLVTLGASDSTIPEWYSVEEWEIEVCSKWGGTAEAQQHGGKAEGSSFMFDTTITLQAAKVLDGNDTIYEVAWYFRPTDSQQKYEVSLVGKSTKEIYTGNAQPGTGDSNYHAEFSKQKYDSAILRYETGLLEVPIVEK